MDSLLESLYASTGDRQSFLAAVCSLIALAVVALAWCVAVRFVLAALFPLYPASAGGYACLPWVVTIGWFLGRRLDNDSFCIYISKELMAVMRGK